jgi:hypothetical protein
MALRRFVLDGVAWLGLGYIIKKFIIPLSGKLAENAVLGWADEQIANLFGIMLPTVETIVSWAVALGLAAIVLLVYHLAQHWRMAASDILGWKYFQVEANR